MLVDFTKMHGAGNDFVVIDERGVPVGLSLSQVVGLADRRRGIGCDQLITLEAPRGGGDVFMRIRNPDGSEAGACGNATRCVADLLFRESGRRRVVVETVSGLLPADVDGVITVDMGPARLGWRDIPLTTEMDTLHLALPGDPAAVSMGNPHATFFVDDVDAIETRGAGLERDALFPERANIGFARVLDRETIRLRVWERGAGLTLACGSGACAALVNAARRGLTGRRARLVLDGGALDIVWRDDGHVLMAGPAVTSYTGTVDLGNFAA
jgi:diaminopimelate epimerase